MIPLALAFLWAAALDPAASLASVLARLRADLRRIPNYTCVETVTRQFYVPLAPVRRNCDVLLEMKKTPTLDMKLRPYYTDRLRLEVAMTTKGEIHSWAGAARFEEGSIDTIVREGPMGTGAFAAFLSTTLEQDVRRFQFERELNVDGRGRLVFSFSVPAEESHYKIRVDRSWAITAYRGTIEIDPATEEVTNLWVQTAVLPAAAVTCQTTTDLAVSLTAIGGAAFPLASVARQRFVASDGQEAVNTTRFSNCREYRGESTITFGEPATAAAGDAAAPAPPPPIPPGLAFTTRLDAAIDPAEAAAGDRFIARLATPIRDARGRTLAPRGAKVEGRLLRVQQYHPPRAELIVVLRPESVQVHGARVPIAATQDLQRLAAARKKNPGLEILLPFHWETNAALVRIEGDSATVPRGWSMEWRTR